MGMMTWQALYSMPYPDRKENAFSLNCCGGGGLGGGGGGLGGDGGGLGGGGLGGGGAGGWAAEDASKPTSKVRCQHNLDVIVNPD